MKIYDANGLEKRASGPAGLNGTPGAQGQPGPAIFLAAEDGEDGRDAIPGAPGSQGPVGPAGAPGPALYMLFQDGEDGDRGPPGPAGVGSTVIITANVTPDTHPSPANAADDEFEVGSSIDTAGTRASGATAWAWVNQGTASTAVKQGSLFFTNPVENSPTLRMVTQSPSGLTWTYTAKCTAILPGTNNLTFLVVGRAGKYIVFGLGNNGSTPSLVGQRFTNVTTFASNTFTPGPVATTTVLAKLTVNWAYLQIQYDGTNINLQYSIDGFTSDFAQASTETAASFLGGAPDAIGVGCYTNNATLAPTLVVDWFRKTA